MVRMARTKVLNNELDEVFHAGILIFAKGCSLTPDLEVDSLVRALPLRIA